jgi:hypothetical protein
MLPAPIETLESDAVPAHVPAMDVVEVDAIVGELAPHAVAKDVNNATANIRFMFFIVLPNPVVVAFTIALPNSRHHALPSN